MDNKKWVRLMFDYSSSGLWEKSGVMMDPDDLPVTQELKEKIQQWVKLYDNHSWEEDTIRFKAPDNVSEENSKRLDELKNLCEKDFLQGVALAIEIKNQLPNWTVVVFDYERVLSRPNDEHFNTEITIDFKV